MPCINLSVARLLSLPLAYDPTGPAFLIKVPTCGMYGAHGVAVVCEYVYSGEGTAAGLCVNGVTMRGRRSPVVPKPGKMPECVQTSKPGPSCLDAKVSSSQRSWGRTGGIFAHLPGATVPTTILAPATWAAWQAACILARVRPGTSL
jgi:hypothetical protein